jgi:hypothetical protein
MSIVVDGVIDGLSLAWDADALTKWAEDRNTSAFVDLAREELDTWLATLKRLSVEDRPHLAAMYSDIEELKARLAVMSTREALRILDNYVIEARREPIDERRFMLAHAAVRGRATRLSLPMLSRVERTIRELDPADVMVLAHVAEDPVERGGLYARQRWPQSTQVLTAAGCLTIMPGGTWDGLTKFGPTMVGTAVLETLEGFVSVRRAEAGGHDPPFEAGAIVPGPR